MAGRTDGFAGPEGMGRSRRRPLGDPALHFELCLGVFEQWLAGFRRRPFGGHLRLLPARLLAGGRGAARIGSRAGGDGAFAWPNLLGMLLSSRAAPASPRSLRRRAAGRAQDPERVRRVCPAALRNLHDRALRSIQNRIRRTPVVPVGRGPPRALRRLSDRRNESARPRPLRACRRGNAAQLSIGAAGLDTMAGADLDSSR